MFYCLVRSREGSSPRLFRQPFHARLRFSVGLKAEQTKAHANAQTEKAKAEQSEDMRQTKGNAAREKMRQKHEKDEAGFLRASAGIEVFKQKEGDHEAKEEPT